MLIVSSVVCGKNAPNGESEIGENISISDVVIGGIKRDEARYVLGIINEMIRANKVMLTILIMINIKKIFILF